MPDRTSEEQYLGVVHKVLVLYVVSSSHHKDDGLEKKKQEL